MGREEADNVSDSHMQKRNTKHTVAWGVSHFPLVKNTNETIAPCTIQVQYLSPGMMIKTARNS
jgi:hypothetical protein